MPNFNSAFWKWFGKSKVVDKNGDPLVVWRGEREDDDFDVFERSELGQDIGFFFTPEKWAAEAYTRGKGVLRSFYIRAPKLIDLTKDTAQARKFANQWANEYDFEHDDPLQALHDRELFGNFNFNSVQLWVGLQRLALGVYDAMILPDHDSDLGAFDAVVVFDPHNIKSTDNDGTWDEGDPDIRSNPVIKDGQLIPFFGQKYRFSSEPVSIDDIQVGDMVMIPGFNGGPAVVTRIRPKNWSFDLYQTYEHSDSYAPPRPIEKPSSSIIGSYVVIDGRIHPISR